MNTLNNPPNTSQGYRKRRLLTGLLVLAAVCASAQTRVSFRINPASARQAISPLIYGTNDPYPHAAAKRFGGNRVTNYNWENNASNAGRDWFHESDNYVPWQQGVPDSQYDTPGAAVQAFHQRSLAQQAYSLVTLPMARYVTRDKNGAVTPEQAAPSDRWARVSYRKPGPLSLQPDLTDGAVYVDEELNFLLHHFGQSHGATGIRGYALDNEPGLWASSHGRMWGTTPTSVRYLMDNSYELARRIKEMDPGAEVFGPASWGVSEFENLQFAPDWDQEKGSYPTFLDLYLGRMREKEQQLGKRLLDVLDVHWYPETNRNGVAPFSERTDYATNAVRMAMPRSLWDPTYIENTWIGEDPWKVQQFLPFLPKMHQHINQYYPNTKLAVTEYSYMGSGHASGGIAQADALGIFGRQGVYLATYWGAVVNYIKAGFDLYRNYDGQGGRFGDTSVESATSDLTHSSVFAAIHGEDDSRLHVIALNKNQDGPVTATVTVSGSRQYKSAQVWGFDNSGASIRQLPAVRVIRNNTFEYTLPTLTACHFVLSEEDLSVFPLITEARLDSPAGYSDGTATATLSVNVSDSNNDITRVTADMSELGGDPALPLAPSASEAGLYQAQIRVPAGTAAGLKTIRIAAVDATGHRAEAAVSFRIIRRTEPTVIWDGDAVSLGVGQSFYDPGDTQAQAATVQRSETGGNNQPGSLHLHFEHGHHRYNTLTWRLSGNDNPADARNISDFGMLEFYLKGNAPDNADLEVSLRDASAQLNTSNSVLLKQGGYLSSLATNGYTRVRIPLSALAGGSSINLEQVWQLNFICNTASRPFDVWIDDVRVLPYSHPVWQPTVKEPGTTPSAGYADGRTPVTVSAVVEDPDHNLRTVEVDLSPLGLSNRQPMSLQNGRYVATVTLPAGLSKGVKQLNLVAVDADGNSADGAASFTVNEQASSLVLWDGDVVNTGRPETLNRVTTCVVDEANGHNAPKSMKMHFDMADNGFAAAVWDWNENTNDAFLRDLSTKGYLSFYVKVRNPGPNFDLQVFLKDRFGASTSPIFVRGGNYLSAFTGEYQRVRIPLSALWAGDPIDTRQVVRIGFLSTGLDQPYDFWVDDIEAGGSSVADVRLSSQDARCGDNGAIRVVSINGSETLSGYRFYLNNVANPAGEHSALFSNLAPGRYEVRVEGAGDFSFLETVTVGGTRRCGSAELLVSDAGCQADGSIRVVNISGSAGNEKFYLNGQPNPAGLTNPVFSNLAAGEYAITVTGEGDFRYSQSVQVKGTGEPPAIGADVTLENGKGYINLTVTGGSGIYTYLWSGGAQTQNLWEVPDGTYEVEVTDAATGCRSKASYSIVIPQIEVETENPACAPNGKIRVTSVTGVPGTVRYFLNGQPNPAGSTASLFEGLTPGSYLIKVTGEDGVAVEKEVELEGSGSAPQVTADLSYSGDKGYINLTVTGGSGIYTYEWSNGATTLNLWEVPAGTYTVVVTDLVSQCKTSYTASLSDAAETIMIYPNPVSGQESVWIRYNFMGNSVRKITLTDHLGAVVYTAAVPEWTTDLTVPVRGLRSGTYVVILEGTKVVTRHLVVQ